MSTGTHDPGGEPVAYAADCDPVDHNDYLDACSDAPALTEDPAEDPTEDPQTDDPQTDDDAQVPA
jgi:hypothetical protein